MYYVATKDEIFEIAEAVKERLGDGFRVIEDERQPLELAIARDGDERLFGSRVSIDACEYNGAPYTAVGFRGESNKGNGFSPAYASIIPHDRLELRQFIRFAIACAFNKEIDI